MSGIGFGCVSIYLAEWGVTGYPDDLWKIFAGAAVVALFVVRVLRGGSRVSSVQTARQYDKIVKKLASYRGLATIIVFIDAIFVILIPPLVDDVIVRRYILASGFVVLLVAMSIFAYVEFMYRRIVRGDEVNS